MTVGETCSAREPPHPTPRSVRLFELDFDVSTQAGLLDRIGQAIRAKQSLWLVTVNVHTLCLAHRDSHFLATIRRADIRTADGMPIVWLSGLRGSRLRERVTGSDLLRPLADRAAREGWSLFLCGGGPSVADRLADALKAHAPGIQIVGTASPTIPDDQVSIDAPEGVKALEAIRAASPDILLVALGQPKQESWIAQLRAAGDLPGVVVGVGASFDFLTGLQRRAPSWMRRAGLEWVHRISTQPARLGPRYVRDALTFARLCVTEWTRPRD